MVRGSGLAVGPRVDHEDKSCVSADTHAALLQAKGRRTHAVHIVHLLVNVLRKLDAGANEDRHGCRLPGLLARAAEICRVGIRVARHDGQGCLVREEGGHSDVVDVCSRRLGDGHEHRGRVLAEDSSDVRFRRRTSCWAVRFSVLSGGSTVTAQDVGQLLGRGLGNPKKLELPAQSVAAAAAHGPQLELEDRAPEGAVLGLGGLHPFELREISKEHEGRLVPGRLPEAQQALEDGRRDLADLVQHNQVVACHA